MTKLWLSCWTDDRVLMAFVNGRNEHLVCSCPATKILSATWLLLWFTESLMTLMWGRFTYIEQIAFGCPALLHNVIRVSNGRRRISFRSWVILFKSLSHLIHAEVTLGFRTFKITFFFFSRRVCWFKQKNIRKMFSWGCQRKSGVFKMCNYLHQVLFLLGDILIPVLIQNFL